MLGVTPPQHRDEHERQTLQEYMSKMKDIRTGGRYLDTLNFNKSAATLEQEMSNLRRMYEQEISKLRSTIQNVSSTVFQHEHQHGQLLRASENFKQRIDEQTTSNTESEEKCNELRSCVNKKQEELYRLQFSKQSTSPTQEITSKGQLTKALEENARLKDKINGEVVLNRVTEEKVRQLQHQSEFNSQVAEQQRNDLQDRLSASSNAILSLEERVRQLDTFNQDEHVALMLSTIKETSQRELATYKQDTEVAFDRNVTMLKAQVDTDRKTYETVSTENRRLVGCVEELNTKIRNLQGELTHLDHRNCAADENFIMEKECAARQSEALNAKLTDVQNTVMDKMKELNLVKCENLPLKTESAGLRALIDEEKERMDMDIKADRLDYARPGSNSRFTSHSYAPVATAALLTMDQYVPSAAPIAAPAVIPGTSKHTTAEYNSMAPTSSRCAGYNRAHSAPAARHSEVKSQRRMSTEELGQGRSYFDELFKPRSSTRTQSAGLTRQRVHFDRNCSAKSSLGALTIHEISKDGRYMVLHNSSSTDMEFGGYSIRQNVCAVPVTQFNFPNRMTFRAGSFVTVFAGICSSVLHQPPQQFVSNDEQMWGTGPECTTVLCNAAGKAVAWINATHRQNSLSTQNYRSSSSTIQAIQMPIQSHSKDCTSLTDSPTGITMGLQRLRDCIINHTPGSSLHLPNNQQKQDVTTPQDEQGSVLDTERRRPHTASPLCKSPVTRPLHSATGQRMGSAPMRKYAPSAH